MEYRIATLIAALAMIGAAVWVFMLGPGRRMHRAVSLFLMIRGAFYLGLALAFLVDFRFFAATRYFSIAVPFAAINMGLVYLEQVRGGAEEGVIARDRTVRLVLLALLLVAELAVFMRPELYDDPLVGWIGLAIPLSYLSYVAVAWILFMVASRSIDPRFREGIAVLVVALLIEPAFFPVYAAGGSIFVSPFEYTTQRAGAGIHAVTLVLLALLVGRMLRDGRTDALWRKAGRASAACTSIGVIAGTIMVIWISRLDFLVSEAVQTFNLWLFSIDALLHLALVAGVVYATLNLRIYSFQVGAKRAVDYGAFTIIVAGAFVVGAAAIGPLIGAPGLWTGVVAAVVVLAAWRPLRAMTQHLAESVFPGVGETDEYERRRAAQIYLAALAQARWDNRIDGSDARRLAALSQELGLDPAKADRLAKTLGPRDRSTD